jgi:hypothetical protein
MPSTWPSAPPQVDGPMSALSPTRPSARCQIRQPSLHQRARARRPTQASLPATASRPLAGEMTNSPAGRQAALLAGNSRALWSLLVSFLFSWISYTASIALIGWLVFERTRSPAVVSIAFALR